MQTELINAILDKALDQVRASVFEDVSQQVVDLCQVSLCDVLDPGGQPGDILLQDGCSHATRTINFEWLVSGLIAGSQREVQMKLAEPLAISNALEAAAVRLEHSAQRLRAAMCHLSTVIPEIEYKTNDLIVYELEAAMKASA